MHSVSRKKKNVAGRKTNGELPERQPATEDSFSAGTTESPGDDAPEELGVWGTLGDTGTAIWELYEETSEAREGFSSHPQKYVEVLAILKTSEWDLIWQVAKCNVISYNEGVLESGGPFIQCGRYPYKKKVTWRHRDTHRAGMWQWKQRLELCSCKQRNAKDYQETIRN